MCKAVIWSKMQASALLLKRANKPLIDRYPTYCDRKRVTFKSPFFAYWSNTAPLGVSSEIVMFSSS